MFRFLILILAQLILDGRSAHADEEFRMVRPGSPASETLVIGGRKVSNAEFWPATFQFGTGPDKFCTSTAIGPRVILTAAHCIPDGAKGKVDDIDVVCDHHKDYTPCPGPDEEPGSCPKNKTTSADYALCLTKTDLNIPQYESVNKNAALPKKGDKVLLTGFGCNENGGTDGSFGYLFEGDTAVEVLPAENASEPWAANYIFTKGGAALCYGDSGGPSYKPLDAEAKKRVLIGVNSRSGMHAGDRSYLSATAVQSFTQWAEKWANAGQSTNPAVVMICGIHDGVGKCNR